MPAHPRPRISKAFSSIGEIECSRDARHKPVLSSPALGPGAFWERGLETKIALQSTMAVLAGCQVGKFTFYIQLICDLD